MSREKKESAEAVTPSPAPQPAEDPARRIEQLQQDVQRLQHDHLRLLADVENTRKRLQREKDEYVKYAAESMVRDLLPIVDSMDQALVAVDKQSDPQAVIKGVHLIYRQLLGLLEKEGVKRIPSIGEPFDPHHHEAIGEADAKDGAPEDTIVEEVQRGYTWHGKVLRPSLVKVAKTPPAPDPQRPDNAQEHA